jgi:hypothetical protein
MVRSQNRLKNSQKLEKVHWKKFTGEYKFKGLRVEAC